MKGNPNVLNLFERENLAEKGHGRQGGTVERLQRLDLYSKLRAKILPLCRLKYGRIWEDPVKGHRVGVLDASRAEDVTLIAGQEKAALLLNDPPYNIAVGNANTSNLFKIDLQGYLRFTDLWLRNAIAAARPHSHFYIWIGADYRNGFQPLPDIMILLRHFSELKPRNFITLRNQRGYGTQKNWMWVRQELLYYVRGDPEFKVGAEYTEIPKFLRGYYKKVNGKLTENLERSKSEFIRAGNVWVDVQQVFYRLEENVPGCYAQKPLKAIERIVLAATDEKHLILDFFAHSGTTLIAGEKLDRKVYTFDVDPVFAEISIRRLEHFRATGKTGWQWRNPFPEIESDLAESKWI